MSRPHRIVRVAQWAGWCTPCQSETAPLQLTRSGPGGVLSWLAGVGDDERTLLLTCRVCGGWQHVPAREQDDVDVDGWADLAPVARPVVETPAAELPVAPAPVAEDVRPAAAQLAGGMRALLERRAAEAVPAQAVPEPRRPQLRVVSGGADATSVTRVEVDPLLVQAAGRHVVTA